MTNRKLSFDYRMEQGKAAIFAKEAEVVVTIFQQYAMGASYLDLVGTLKNQPVLYVNNRLWNKNMVARILEDRRYLGDEKYPGIIDEGLFQQSVQKRSTKQVVQPTEAQKVLRRLTGQKVGKEVEQQVLSLLNTLIEKPETIQQPLSTAPRQTTVKLESELEQLLESQPIDENAVHRLIRQIAATKYESIPSEEYETRRLRHIFSKAETMEELDAGLLKSTVVQIEITNRVAVSIRLKNNQIIERSPDLCLVPM